MRPNMIGWIPLLLLLLAMATKSQNIGSRGWELLQSQRHATKDIEEAKTLCSQSCAAEWKCRSWSAMSTANPEVFECFLESIDFIRVKDLLPRGVFRVDSPPHDDWHQYSITNIEVDAKRILRGPIAVDSTMHINSEHHFARGCAYTVSLWVWLFEPHAKQQNAEIPILQSRPLPNADSRPAKEVPKRNGVVGGMPGSGYNETEEALTPSIVYNVGNAQQKGTFFFSAARDARDHIHGFWSVVPNLEVQYNQWTHLAMSITENGILRAYINGRIVGSLRMEASRQATDQGNNVNGIMRCPYNFGTKAYFGKRISPILARNNTVMQVMSLSTNGGGGTPGMIQDLTIIQNKALDDEEVQSLLRIRPPVQFPTLTKLMLEYGIQGGGDVIPWCPLIEQSSKNTIYHYKHGGLCPTELCGETCLNPEFFHDLPDKHTQLTEHQRAYHVDKASSRIKGRDNGIHRAAANFQYIPDPKELHELAESKKRKYDADGNEISSQKNHTFLTRMVETLESYLQWLENSPSDDLESDLTEEDLHQRSLQELFDSRVAQRLAIEKRNRRRRYEEMVEELYDSAMIWMHGSEFIGQVKHEHSQLRKFHESDIDLLVSNSSQWRAEMYEKSMSALILAMWITNDNSVLNPRARKQYWSYHYSSMVSQPLHLALAQRDAYDKHHDVVIPSDLGSYLNKTLNGLDIVHLLGIDPRHKTRENGAFIPAGGSEGSSYGGAKTESGVAASFVVKEPWKLIAQSGIDEDSFFDSPVTQPNAAVGGIRNVNSWYHIFDAYDQEDSGLIEIMEDDGAKLKGDLVGLEVVGLNASTLQRIYAEIASFDASEYSRDASNLMKELKFMLLNPKYADLSLSSKNIVSNVALKRETFKEEDDPRIRTENALLETARFAHSSIGTTREAFTSTVSECQAAVAHLFPVAQFIASHYGQITSGVTALEDVRILSSDLSWQMGEENETHQLQEQEAAEGNENAMLFLARRYFWGQAGVEADPVRARHWFEQAAMHGNAEGLYNVGVLHSSGQLGYRANQTAAQEYFEKASNPERPDQSPFPMALHAVGAHYRETDAEKARSYFLRAANSGSADGHYSFATMLQEGSGGPVDIPGCVYHLVQAANAGHVRAMNFLAHGLYDVESWLNSYGRQQAFKEYMVANKAEATRYKIAEAQGIDLMKNMIEPVNPYYTWKQKMYDQKVRQHALDEAYEYTVESPEINTSQSDSFHDGFKFTENTRFHVQLPHGIVELPHPLGRGNSCPASLHLMKYLCMMSYRTNDLMDAALNSYFEGNLLESLEYYNEAAELGVQAAIENSMVLYEMLMESQCSAGSFIGEGWSFDDFLNLGKKDIREQERTLDDASKKLNDMTASSSGKDTDNNEKCLQYFQTMIYRRRVQLANSGDAQAKGELAATYLNADNVTESDIKTAAELLVFAAEQGDIASLMNLGWLFYHPDMSFQNISISKLLMNYVGEWEQSITGGDHSWDYTSISTGGYATSLALLYMSIDEQFAEWGLGGLRVLIMSWKYFLSGVYNDAMSFFLANSDNPASLQEKLGSCVPWNKAALPYPESSAWIFEKIAQRGDQDRTGRDSLTALLFCGVLFLCCTLLLLRRRVAGQDRPQHQ